MRLASKRELKRVMARVGANGGRLASCGRACHPIASARRPNSVTQPFRAFTRVPVVLEDEREAPPA